MTAPFLLIACCQPQLPLGLVYPFGTCTRLPLLPLCPPTPSPLRFPSSFLLQDPTNPPAWVSELLTTGIGTPVWKSSKYLSGAYYFFPERTGGVMPHWFRDDGAWQQRRGNLAITCLGSYRFHTLPFRSPLRPTASVRLPCPSAPFRLQARWRWCPPTAPPPADPSCCSRSPCPRSWPCDRVSDLASHDGLPCQLRDSQSQCRAAPEGSASS